MNFKGEKTDTVKNLIESMLDVLDQVGVPIVGTDRRKEKMAMACLAVGGIRTSFSEVKSSNDDRFLKTRDIINFENENYSESISPGSYDDIRRKDLVFPVEAGVIINSADVETQAVNNPTRGYALAPHFAELLINYGKNNWSNALQIYRQHSIRLAEELKRKKEMERIPVTIAPGVELKLSSGEHNVLQKKIIEEFLPAFGMGAELLYIGDTENKYLFLQEDKLKEIGFFKIKHEELPDVVAYSKEKNILFMIEAVHSAGPMSEVRVRKLLRQLKKCQANIVFVTAFLDKKTFRKWVVDIAWETEVWIAEAPEHMIHFNGYKFLEMHK